MDVQLVVHTDASTLRQLRSLGGCTRKLESNYEAPPFFMKVSFHIFLLRMKVEGSSAAHLVGHEDSAKSLYHIDGGGEKAREKNVEFGDL